MMNANFCLRLKLDNWTPADMKAATSTQFASKQAAKAANKNCHLPSDLSLSLSLQFFYFPKVVLPLFRLRIQFEE